MTDITKLIRMFFSTLLFILGVFLFMKEILAVDTSISAIRKGWKEEETVFYEQYIPDEDVIPCAKLIASLFHEQEYDIEINGCLIRRQEHKVGKIMGYGIEDTEYKKSYQYDIEGNIERIQYTPVR
ncbi:MAG TPA: hypothetical protein DHW85_10800 [Lachnospiraceae bacterium]|nr:hypothetical protein [Lachnospiraceae bacterium]HCR40563.1 hypothetical protein [Lachnospiraceae bacterium]